MISHTSLCRRGDALSRVIVNHDKVFHMLDRRYLFFLLLGEFEGELLLCCEIFRFVVLQELLFITVVLVLFYCLSLHSRSLHAITVPC